MTTDLELLDKVVKRICESKYYKDCCDPDFKTKTVQEAFTEDHGAQFDFLGDPDLKNKSLCFMIREKIFEANWEKLTPEEQQKLMNHFGEEIIEYQIQNHIPFAFEGWHRNLLADQEKDVAALLDAAGVTYRFVHQYKNTQPEYRGTIVAIDYSQPDLTDKLNRLLAFKSLEPESAAAHSAEPINKVELDGLEAQRQAALKNGQGL